MQQTFCIRPTAACVREVPVKRRLSARISMACLFLALSGAAMAKAIQCPPEAVANEQDSRGKEAWCELKADPSLLHGPYKAWYPNGVLGSEENYVRGKASGKATYRWGSGHKQASGTYKDGVRDGWWAFWDKNGVKAGRVQYENGAMVAGHLPRWAEDWGVLPVARRAPRQP